MDVRYELETKVKDEAQTFSCWPCRRIPTRLELEWHHTLSFPNANPSWIKENDYQRVIDYLFFSFSFIIVVY